MAWTVRAVEFARATRGWRCEIAFRVPTHRQCTWEDHAVYDGAPGRGLLSVLRAFLAAKRAVRAEVRRLQAIPGPWTLDGRPARAPAARTPETIAAPVPRPPRGDGG